MTRGTAPAAESLAVISADRYGWPVKDWAFAVGISRSTAWNLLKEGRISSVSIGVKRIITTHPAEYLESLHRDPRRAGAP